MENGFKEEEKKNTKRKENENKLTKHASVIICLGFQDKHDRGRYFRRLWIVYLR